MVKGGNVLHCVEKGGEIVRGYVWEECLDPQYLDGAYLEPSSLWPSVQHLTVLFCCSRPQQEDRQEDIEEWVLIT